MRKMPLAVRRAASATATTARHRDSVRQLCVRYEATIQLTL